ncbi:DNA-directed RNA polymerase subunit beta [Nocardia sp. NBC_00508]|uniref:DNA-directed RNA polymerase subunit beta n=1 Tax=Nocardia sp. NBC_00508 TaxID=2975992 RepID=UPI002E7FE924|nr:DNA-directed RNA polymerase subunit beta [Nocardia sp. NBC_00508]WUD65042.1 DNA-directed RNA polymerase subunit beta [Nocardia sp. NBC_00508]
MNHAAFADTPASRCAFYRRTCGLPAGIHPEIGRIVVKAGVVGGITMPDRMGQWVRDDMLFRGHPLGPVVAHIRSRRWTFLCRPDLPDDTRLFAALFRLDVSVVPFGGEIALPSPADANGGFRRWVVAPRDTFRPSGAVIVDCVLTCAGRSVVGERQRVIRDNAPSRAAEPNPGEARS